MNFVEMHVVDVLKTSFFGEPALVCGHRSFQLGQVNSLVLMKSVFHHFHGLSLLSLQFFIGLSRRNGWECVLLSHCLPPDDLEHVL